jgi:broad specificity phosphatase PhoE
MLADPGPSFLLVRIELGPDGPPGPRITHTPPEMTARFRGAVDGVTPATGEPTVIVAHGGAIRSYISSLTTTTDSYSESLYTPRNTGVSHVALTDKGPMIIDYAVAFHLEGMDV